MNYELTEVHGEPGNVISMFTFIARAVTSEIRDKDAVVLSKSGHVSLPDERSACEAVNLA